MATSTTLVEEWTICVMKWRKLCLRFQRDFAPPRAGTVAATRLPMPPKLSISSGCERLLARIADLILRCAEDRGLPRAKLLRGAGLSQDPAPEQGHNLNAAHVEAMLDVACLQTDDSAFPLHVARNATPQDFDALGFLFVSHEDLASALGCLTGLLGARFGTTNLGVTQHGGGLDVACASDGLGHGHPRLLELLIASAVQIVRGIASEDVSPERVVFAHLGEVTEHHQRFFACPVRFGAGRTAVTLSAKAALVQLRPIDENLRIFLLHAAQDQLARLPTHENLGARAERAVIELLPGQSPSLSAVARHLGVSRRTLQRRLSEEGTSFSKVLDGARCLLATTQLRHSDSDLWDVANLLAFSDPSAFVRAFRRWTGMTPGQWRRSQRTPESEAAAPSA